MDEDRVQGCLEDRAFPVEGFCPSGDCAGVGRVRSPAVWRRPCQKRLAPRGSTPARPRSARMRRSPAVQEPPVRNANGRERGEGVREGTQAGPFAKGASAVKAGQLQAWSRLEAVCAQARPNCGRAGMASVLAPRNKTPGPQTFRGPGAKAHDASQATWRCASRGRGGRRRCRSRRCRGSPCLRRGPGTRRKPYPFPAALRYPPARGRSRRRGSGTGRE